MAARRNTPLDNPDIEGHHCTVGERLEKLGMVPFFENLGETELRDINGKFNAIHFAQGETIYFQDEKAHLLRVVVHGHVKLVRQTMEGKDILLDMLKPGEFFGTLSTSGDAVYNLGPVI
jgi:CRP-like cAMP-binding protein